MTTITRSALVELTADLVSYPSINPPGNEGEIGAYVVDWLESSAIPFEIDVQELEPGRSNVVARAGDPEKGSLLLTGHMDVVSANADQWTGDPFELRRDDTRIVGRGVTDMKGALAAKLLAAESYIATEDSGEVVIAFVVGEETTGFGTKALVESGLNVDAALLGEPSDLQPSIAQKGTVRYDVTVRGRSCHSGRPDKGINAIEGARHVLDNLHAFDQEIRRFENPLLSPGSVSVTEIKGGSSHNVIPDTVTLTVDCRILPGSGETPASFDRKMGRWISGAFEEGSVEYDRWSFSPPAETSPDESVVDAVLSAATDVGHDCELTGFNATTDARHFIHDGVPAVVVGPGSIESDAHTVDESVAVGDLVTTAQIYRQTLERFLG